MRKYRGETGKLLAHLLKSIVEGRARFIRKHHRGVEALPHFLKGTVEVIGRACCARELYGGEMG